MNEIVENNLYKVIITRYNDYVISSSLHKAYHCVIVDHRSTSYLRVWRQLIYE